MTGPDPAGQPPWARFGHRQCPRGHSHFLGQLQWLIVSPSVTGLAGGGPLSTAPALMGRRARADSVPPGESGRWPGGVASVLPGI